MKLFRTILICSVIFGPFIAAQAATTGPAAFLGKIDKQLCVKFKSLKCHRKSSKPAGPKAKTIPAPPVAPAEAVPPEPVPKPVLKPEVPAQKKHAAVLPRMKPEDQSKAPPLPHTVTKVPEEPEATPVVPPAPIVKLQPSDFICLAALKAKGVDFASVAQPPGLPACVVVQPVQIKSVLLKGGVLQLPDHPILNCNFALNFVSWLQDSGAPAAAAAEGSSLAQLYTGPGYQCRGRNGDITAKISEHGYGNAVDVERVKFSDGLTVLIYDAPDPTAPGYDALKAIRASACTRFTTVLGPGSNEAHRAHFHFDSGVHGKSGTYKICE